ncbi:hypothetical protein [uncultured Gilvimarinus sp.]|uniref:hypothetical protein n=1 Tax=uncultured Gilvimarinus sp. TaxID=1689143 RepID=UPI0030ED139E
MKRYRRPKVIEGQIKMQKGKIDGDVDMCIFYGDNVPRCDRALVMNALCSKRQRIDLETMRPKFDPSLIEELEARGYDLDTLQFSIKRKADSKRSGGGDDA